MCQPFDPPHLDVTLIAALGQGPTIFHFQSYFKFTFLGKSPEIWFETKHPYLPPFPDIIPAQLPSFGPKNMLHKKMNLLLCLPCKQKLLVPDLAEFYKFVCANFKTFVLGSVLL